MSRDSAMLSSRFKRLEGDRYFTEPKWTRALLPFIPQYVRAGVIWEPAAGRGDIVRVLKEDDYICLASDIDLSEFDENLCPHWGSDFLLSSNVYMAPAKPLAIITNPPYGSKEDGKTPLSERFVRHALSMSDIGFVAMLLRSEFNSAGSRSDLFTPQANFAFEIVLTQRPRWDWWLAEDQRSSPRHNFSWFVWDRYWNAPSTQYFTGSK